MDPFVVRDGKQLRRGYTTGTCAAAAAKAAALMLLSGEPRKSVCLVTPKGSELTLPVLEIRREADAVSCAVRKDSGDDPDVTNGILIYARVSFGDRPEILIDGGEGIGRVTKPGLDQPVGAAAINSVPRKMIREGLEELRELYGITRGFSVLISAPEGAEIAKKTFNSRLGIVGGISILGTSGIVEPMSDQALIDTIRLELNQRRVGGADSVILTPGNYGMDFIRAQYGILPSVPVMVSNFIGDAVDSCRELGFRNAVLVGHIGKLVKLAGGMMNTHSRYGDCRMEILAAYGAASGLPAEKTAEILECVTCDEALRILTEEKVSDKALAFLIRKAADHLQRRAGDGMEIGLVIFSNVYGVLCETENASVLLARAAEG